MDIDLKPGRYVVAVSGGVDSVALLHVLHHKNLYYRVKPWELVVGHFDHGMREDSRLDRELVQELAKVYGLQFEYEEGRLGGGVSEAAARSARYGFLERTKKTAGAQGIITAHHQDDLLETAVINLVRGTGRRGLSSLKSTAQIARPLLNVTKKDLLNYAHEHQLRWREDSTNQDTKYLRNHIRHNILPRFSADDKQLLLQHIHKMHEQNRKIDRHVATYLDAHPAVERLDRQRFILLPHIVAQEVMASWLRTCHVRSFDRNTILRLVIATKTCVPGKQIDVTNHYFVSVGVKYLALQTSDR